MEDDETATMYIWPVRCQTCNKVLARKSTTDTYVQTMRRTGSVEQSLASISGHPHNIKRVCCKKSIQTPQIIAMNSVSNAEMIKELEQMRISEAASAGGASMVQQSVAPSPSVPQLQCASPVGPLLSLPVQPPGLTPVQPPGLTPVQLGGAPAISSLGPGTLIGSANPPKAKSLGLSKALSRMKAQSTNGIQKTPGTARIGTQALGDVTKRVPEVPRIITAR